MRTDLVKQLAQVIDDLPHGFHTEVFGGGYSKCMGYVSHQVWGNKTYALHVAVSMMETFKLTRKETFLLALASERLDVDDKRTLRGISCGFIEYCMGSYVPRYARRKVQA